MRFGAPVLEKYNSPKEWVNILKRRGYRAANSPVREGDSEELTAAYAKAAAEADIVIAEHGAWGRNCLDYDDTRRKAALEGCAQGLATADKLGAWCCVALSGSRADKWDAPHHDNFSEDTFALAVDNIRFVIDAVRPKRAYFALEPMPWTLPYDADSQERLIKAVDRAAYGVHYDPVNLVCSPDTYYRSGWYMQDFVKRFGPKIRACHIKDVELIDAYVFQLHERAPGEGTLDYPALFRALDGLSPDLPITTEHLPDQESFDRAERFIRAEITRLGLRLR
ncbi:MAG: sugar phosphate isomerase/epimerase [Clostridiales bacterium]|jgi:sugar phosphate isomerase/epimerase|nr:sugar phosphate isomerase/epimerase [Clostridiales bacterium]